jgi:phosphatidylglycerol:prolipoprotein diacylglycerol transferase
MRCESSLVLAHFVHQFSPFVFEIREGVGPRWYGVAYVVAFVLGFWLYRWLARRGYTEMPPEQVGDFITWCAVFGVMLGGRLGWAILYAWRDVASDPLMLLRVWEGGMASHGGIIGLVLFTFYWSRRHRLSWTSVGDCLCVVAPIGLFLVRIANFINGELYGKPAGVPWAVIFPADPLQVPRHPSQLYEALLEGALLFAILWLMRTRMRLPRGVITGAFFIGYAALRIIGEIFREPDPAWAVGSISAGQFLSLFLVIIGAAFVVGGMRARQFEPVFAAPGQAPRVSRA